MTFAEILSSCYRRLGLGTSPPAETVTRIKDYVNEAQQELAGMPGLAALLRGSTTLASVASQAVYALPPYVTRVTSITQGSQRRRLMTASEGWWRSVAPDPTVTLGTPAWYVPLGPHAVAAQPSATGVWAASSSASDTAGPTVSVEAIRTGGYPHTPAATALTGVTRVQIGTQTDYTEVTDLYLSAACVGDVTLYDAAAAGNTLAVIGKGQLRSRYEWIALYLTPSSVLTYTVNDERDATDLVNASDEAAWLPLRFHRLLAVGARKREYEKTDSDNYDKAEREWEMGVAQLLSYVTNKPDELVIPGGPGRSGVSDLGSNYPAGTIWD